MKEANYKPPKVEKYNCPVCGNAMKVSFGSPAESICDDCKQAFLRNHEQDQLENCPFCNAGRDRLRHGLFVPYFYGTEGVMVVCKECGARGGIGDIRKKITWGEPSLFNRETIEDGFKKANEKWNRRAADESPFYT